MTDTLRDRANMEILDVWKNVNRQVFGREKQQIAVFPETIMPNTQRDTGTEVSVDKLVEQFNKTMEAKLGPLEAIIMNFREFSTALIKTTGFASSGFDSNYSIATTTGDIIPLWNQIVRYYTQPGLSKDSQEKIKMSLQQLEPNLKALQYGYQEAIDKVFAGKQTITRLDEAKLREEKYEAVEAKTALTIMELLRADSVYKMIAQQIHSTGFQMLDNEALNSAYKNNFQSLSQNEVAFIKAYAPRSGIMPTGIRNIPDFGSQTTVQKLKQIQEELGIRFPEETLSEFRKMPMNQLNEELDMLRNKGVNPNIKVKSKLMEEKNELETQLARYGQMYSILNAEIESLKRNDPAIQGFQPLPVPVVRRRPVSSDASDEVLQRQAEQIKEDSLERDRIREYNQFYLDLEKSNKDEKMELIIHKEKELEDLEIMWNKTVGDLIFVDQKLQGDTIQTKTRTTPVLEEYAKKYPVEGFGKPKRTRVDTRGLASMRDNYGKPEESESESESDEGDSDEEGGDMDFDDDRNEHYTRRPVPYY